MQTRQCCRWELSAPESLVLLMGPDISDTWAVEVGLLELVARGYLDIADARWAFLVRALGFRPRKLVRTQPPASTGCQSLDTLLSFVPSGNRGASVKSIAGHVLSRQVMWVPRRRSTRKKLTGRGYVYYDVLPDLERRGLYDRSAQAGPGMTTIWQWSQTPAGLEALAELWEMVAVGKGPFVEWASSDPERAMAHLDRANSTVFMVRRIVPTLRRLADAQPRRIEGSPVVAKVWPLAMSLPVAALLRTWPTGDLDQTFNAVASEVDASWSALQRGATHLGFGE